MMYEEQPVSKVVVTESQASDILLKQDSSTHSSLYITSQNLDDWIDQLKSCRLLSEANVMTLCEKVMTAVLFLF